MSIVRWDPFAEMMTLRDAMNRLFEESFVRPTGGTSQLGMMGAPVDLRETENEFILEAALPGIKPDQVDITILGNQITLQAETKGDEGGQSGDRYHLRERRQGRLQRTVILPTNVQADGVQAHFDNGILTLTLPKAPEARPRRIAIGQSAGQGQLDQGQSGQTGHQGQQAGQMSGQGKQSPQMGSQGQQSTPMGHQGQQSGQGGQSGNGESRTGSSQSAQ